MDSAGISASIGILKALTIQDDKKREQEAAKSNLEAYIYKIRETVAEDEAGGYCGST